MPDKIPSTVFTPISKPKKIISNKSEKTEPYLDNWYSKDWLEQYFSTKVSEDTTSSTSL